MEQSSRARTGRLSLPDASLYYEVRGSGPALLLIATGNGDATPYGPMADALAETRTVISYDRRGFSRSTRFTDGPDDGRVAEDASDARHLIDHLAGGRADVFGSCSGGVVALQLLQQHPDRVRRIVVHEPPLASVLPDAEHWIGFYDDLYTTYRRHGLTEAKAVFREHVGLGGETRPPAGSELPPAELERLLTRLRRNTVYWFEHEVRSWPRHRLDLDALRAVADRLVPAGSDTGRQEFAYRPIRALAEQLDRPLTHLPGGHAGPVTHPSGFADDLLRLFAG
ncbi:alpha/beta hydrolase [Actinoplanes sp. LDG1-06]|uniref:Alpha/beta hydrolase n=1 Tax=Paractinoplanes ovalisporus TaxID=2810368 RepID=A0ABS2AJY3_9ACTN|nr:alpha/beta hydrolase [Actinoplanes ovalisporus]